MRHFSIKELEQFSHIKAHTIRIWEKRYNIIKPSRSQGNIRMYDLETLRHFLDLALLNKNGFNISTLAKMTEQQVKKNINTAVLPINQDLYAVHKLIYYMFSCRTEEFEDVLDKALLAIGVDATIKKVILPFLEKVNLLSYRDSSNEVHFTVTALRKKLIAGIEQTKVIDDNGGTALLFLPENEHYDLMLLYMTYIIKGYGVKVLYMGTNISDENISRITLEKKPNVLYTYLGPKKKFQMPELLNSLHSYLPGAKLVVVGSGKLLTSMKDNANLQFVHYNNLLATLHLGMPKYTLHQLFLTYIASVAYSV